MGSPFKFQRYGQCDMEISTLLPRIGSIADDLCLVRSMWSDNNNHPQATRCLNTGKIFPGRWLAPFRSLVAAEGCAKLIVSGGVIKLLEHRRGIKSVPVSYAPNLGLRRAQCETTGADLGL